MPTRNVVLTERQATFIGTLVEIGRYQNASEVLRDGLRLIEQRELEDQARIEALRSAADQGIADLEAGRYPVFASADHCLDWLSRDDPEERQAGETPGGTRTGA